MLTLDLFKSSYEQALLEGRVDEVSTPEEEDDGPPIPSNLKQFSTPNNWGVVSGKWAEIQDAVRLNVPYVTLNWPTSGTATLTRNQLWTIYQRAVKMSRPKRTSWGLTTLNDPKNLLYWIANTKIIARPEQKRPPADPSQGELPLDDLKEKKSSEISVDSPYKDVRVQRAVKKAAFDNPAAASPEEAFIKSMLDAQDKDQEDIAKLRQSTQQQRELLSKNIKKDNEQENLISNISSEIQKVDQENHSLQKMQQNMAAANARLQKTLDAMRGKKVEPAPTSNVGVSVATDKIQEPTVAVEPAPTQDDSAQIQKLRSTIARLTKQMKNRLDQGQNDELVTQLRTRIGSLEDQLAQVTNQPPQQLDLELGKPEQKPKPKSKKSPVKYRRVAAPQKTSPATGLDVEPIDIGPGPTAVHENNMIESQEEFVFYINGKPAAKYQNEADALRDMAIIKKKYPNAVLDLKQEVCDLETIKHVAEGSSLFEELPSKATHKLQQWKNQRNQQAQQAQPVATTAPVEPQPQPARLSDLQARHQKVEALFDLKTKIEIAKDKATKGGRILPRGLAADLEDYYSMDDIDTHYDQMLAAYQKQLKAIEQYLSMKKILNKKVTHEMRASELQETKESPAWEEGGREGYYHRPNKNPYKPGTQEHSDYNRGYEHFKGDKDWDVPKRRSVPEDTKSEFKAVALAKIKKALSNPKLDPDTRKDYETRLKKIQALEEGRAGYNPLTSKDHWHEVERYLASQINDRNLDPESRAEARRRYQEKRKEAQQKGWAK